MNDLYFTVKNKKAYKDQSLSQKVYIIRHEVAEYHQCGALYIIIMEFFLHAKSVMIYKKERKNRSF